jgi:hypothetical protein
MGVCLTLLAFVFPDLWQWIREAKPKDLSEQTAHYRPAGGGGTRLPTNLIPPSASAPGSDGNETEATKRAKEAVALVVSANTNIVGSAVCVDRSGLFLTHEQAVQYSVSQSVQLVLNPGLAHERLLPGRIIHSNSTQSPSGLALIRVDAKDLSALEIASLPAQADVLNLTSLGFPFTITPNAAYPQVAIKTGQGTVCLGPRNEVQGIQLHPQLRQATYGSPLLDGSGRVVAIQSTDLAIPAGRLSEFLAEARRGLPRVAVAGKDKSPGSPAMPPAKQATPPAENREYGILELSGTVRNAVVGGAGRYLILHMLETRELIIFDALEAKVIRSLPLPGEDVQIAAGRTKLLIALPERNVLQRWSLITFEREVATTVPVWVNLRVLAMGAATDELLMAGGGLIDVSTMRVMPIRQGPNGLPTHESVFVRTSGDGRVLGGWSRPGIDSAQLAPTVFVLAGDEVKYYPLHAGFSGYALPSANGRVIHTANGLFTPEGKTTPPGTQARESSPSRFPERLASIPAANNALYVGARYGEANAPDVPGYKPGYIGSFLYIPDDPEPIASLPPGIFQDIDHPGNSTRELPRPLRLYFLPDANLIVTIPPTLDRLHLYRINVDELLAKSGRAFLFVSSLPSTHAKKGAAYQYAVAAKSNKSGLKYRLDLGPPGMKITEQGRLTWLVPVDFDFKEATVILAVTNSSGQECFQSFTILIGA